MTDSLSGGDVPPSPAAAPTAGSLLRQARQARGLHIAALATSIKVAPRKLELLESDRFEELPGATFTRALAQTVCRTLKIDAAPVLALLPSATALGLEQMSRGLNEPFRDRPGRSVPKDLAFLKNPLLLGALLLLGLAAAVYMLPSGWIAQHMPQRGTQATEAAAPADGSPVVSETVPAGDLMPPDASGSSPAVYSAPAEPAVDAPASTPLGLTSSAPPAAVAASTPTIAAPAVAAVVAASVPAVGGALQLRVTSQSWVEVTDRRGTSLLSRMLQPGETVAVDGASPLRLKIGNAQATQVTFKGERIDLAPITSRENVARLELK